MPCTFFPTSGQPMFARRRNFPRFPTLQADHRQNFPPPILIASVARPKLPAPSVRQDVTG